jgi:ACS family allantoate permease-like MFS transporter
MYSIAYGVGNLIGPQTFRPQDAPRYRSGEITVLACFGVCFLIMAFVYLALKAENRRKAKLRAEPGYEKMENQEWMDLTDRENTEFVYTL